MSWQTAGARSGGCLQGWQDTCPHGSQRTAMRHAGCDASRHVVDLVAHSSSWTQRHSERSLHWQAPACQPWHSKNAAMRSSSCLRAFGMQMPPQGPDSGVSTSAPDRSMSGPFLMLTVAYASLADFFFMAPHTAADLIFGPVAAQHDYQHAIFFRLFAGFLELVALQNWVLKDSVQREQLGRAASDRGSAALCLFAAVSLAIPMLSHLTDPIIMPGAALAWGGLSATQWLVACRGHAQRHPWGSQPMHMLRGYIQDCLDVGHSNGPRSGLFSIFTATFLVMGLSFVLLPELTKTGMFGHDPHLAAEDRLLWQLIGAAIATVVSPVACTQQEAAWKNCLCKRPQRLLMAGLSTVSSGVIFALTPQLLSGNAGEGLRLAALPWASLCLISLMLSLKPRDGPGWFTPW
ncbi:hypothetical protein WJX74_002519 [Apatococcus lobatus]|uniref:Uncharacterized protein n=1 Tax=Apatococcus lobatus TaxID=904363 RepID=A0AAW1QLD4_9CHLO